MWDESFHQSQHQRGPEGQEWLRLLCYSHRSPLEPLLFRTSLPQHHLRCHRVPQLETDQTQVVGDKEVSVHATQPLTSHFHPPFHGVHPMWYNYLNYVLLLYSFPQYCLILGVSCLDYSYNHPLIYFSVTNSTRS